MVYRWGNNGIVTDFIFLGSKITEDSDCRHEIKRHLLLERKAMIILGSILKSRGITFPTKVCIFKLWFSSSHVWMWELDHKEGWAPENWCLWTVVLEKTLDSPLDCREIKSVHPKGNQAWIFIGRTVAEAPIFCHLMQRANSLEKSLILGRIEGRKYWGWQRMKWLDSIIDSMDMSLSKHWEIVKDREAWHASVHGITKIQTWLSDWTTGTNN